MDRFFVRIEASVDAGGGADPLLEVLVGGAVVSSASVTAVTGVGSDILLFTLEMDQALYPSSLSFRFNGGSGDGSETVTLEDVRINGQQVNSDLTGTLLTQGTSQSISSTAAIDHVFGRTAPTAGDLDTVTASGTAGADELTGDNTDDVIDGAGGNDTLRGFTGDDSIIGGAGNDKIFGEAGNDIAIGGAGNDRMFGNNGDDLLYGEGDDDRLFGGAGNDTLSGGAGNDVLAGDSGDDILYGEAGNDRLIGNAGADSIYGDAGNDTLVGKQGDDTLYGGDNDDTILGGSGDDEIYGENGADFIFGDIGGDIIDGGAGIDFIWGGDDADTISGGTENDQLFGDAGNDTLNGDAGNDTIVGGLDADILNGGGGNDLMRGHGLDAFAVSSILRNNPGVVFSQENNSFYQLVSSNVSFSAAQAAAANTSLNGIDGHLVTITSQTENDYVESLASGNQIWINAADSGVEGEWRWAGGNEDGLLLWNGDSSGSAQNGFFTNWAGGQPDDNGGEDAAIMQASGLWSDADATNANHYVIEWDGADFSDDNAVDTLNGGDNDDLLFGNGGNDTINGDAGIDHLFGNDGDDVMNGGLGNDFLYDDTGANTFNGNDGNDTLDARFQTAIPSINEQIQTLLASNPGLNYSSDTGNFYELVTTQETWANALSTSETMQLNGVNGHLVTITSQAENDFVEAIHLGNVIWLAASDEAVEGEWRWMAGPETGQQFWQGNIGGSPVGGMFNQWDNNEPNDYQTGEDYATMWQGGGDWNDNGGPGNPGMTEDYVVEWEGSDVLITPPTEPSQTTQTMYGGAGDDTIYGGNGGDDIYGEADNDYVESGAGDDSADGGDGDDTIYGGLGSDTLTGGLGNDTIYANTDPGATAIPLNASFDVDEEGFTYSDGGPWGGNDGGGINVSGSHIAGDGNDAAGSIEVNFNATGNSSNSSGSFDITVNLTSAMDAAQLSFAYRMFLDTSTENGEDVLVYADIDGTQYGTGGNNYVDGLFGNSVDGTSAWQTVTLDIGALSSGNHTITLGGNYTASTTGSEDAWIRFDDVVLSNAGGASTDDGATNIINGGDGDDTIYGSTGTDTLNGGLGDDVIRSGSDLVYTAVSILNNNFNSGTESYNYADDIFQGTNEPAYADGSRITNDGATGNGALEVVLGGVDSSNVNDMSGAWQNTFNLAQDTSNITLTFSYRALNSGGNAFDNGEDLQLYADIDGTLYGTNGNNFFLEEQDPAGNYDSNWNTLTLDIGNLGAGNHTLSLGGYLTRKTVNTEEIEIRFDDVTMEGGVLDSSVFTTLAGGEENDTLYGSDGTDIFDFDHIGNQNADTIEDFDSSADSLDLRDLLTAYDPVTDAITDFVRITDQGGGSEVKVDTAGNGNFNGNARLVADISGVTGLTDEAALEAAGNLITS